MSRIGKLPITVPSGVKIALDGADLRVEGPKGALGCRLPVGVTVAQDGEVVRVGRISDGREDRARHGLAQRLVANMVQGVSQGFTQVLEITGVGYRADARGDRIHFSLGYSHPIIYQLPEGVSAKVDRQVVITLESRDRQILGEVAAQIRGLRPPEPYKGKGIKYANEKIRRKAGKAAGGK